MFLLHNGWKTILWSACIRTNHLRSLQIYSYQGHCLHPTFAVTTTIAKLKVSKPFWGKLCWKLSQKVGDGRCTVTPRSARIRHVRSENILPKWRPVDPRTLLSIFVEWGKVKDKERWPRSIRGYSKQKVWGTGTNTDCTSKRKTCLTVCANGDINSIDNIQRSRWFAYVKGTLFLLQLERFSTTSGPSTTTPTACMVSIKPRHLVGRKHQICSLI